MIANAAAPDAVFDMQRHRAVTSCDQRIGDPCRALVYLFRWFVAAAESIDG
jgi:hypothetical protein